MNRLMLDMRQDLVEALGEQQSLARQAHDLTVDLRAPSRPLYWLDLTLTSATTYGALALAVAARDSALSLLAAAVCVLALYRAVSFIHEISHLRTTDVPGFRLAWNALIGVPFLVPSLMYEGVHNLHHAKDRYGTARDPEYLPLGSYPPGRLAAFMGMALLAPVGVVLRFGILTPLSFAAPSVRRLVTTRLSALTINPAFRREDAPVSRKPAWLIQEIACWLWCWSFLGAVITGLVPWRTVAICAGILSVMTFLNQLRTVCAHYWGNEGDKMSFEAQFLDSVNVPPPALLPALWAPVGLRYHALHHLLPRLPYHNLGKAHRRLSESLSPRSPYHRVEEKGLILAMGALFRRARGRQAGNVESPPSRATTR